MLVNADKRPIFKILNGEFTKPPDEVHHVIMLSHKLCVVCYAESGDGIKFV